MTTAITRDKSAQIVHKIPMIEPMWRDEFQSEKHGTIVLSTIWLPSPWCWHETAVMWGNDNFTVVGVNPGTYDAEVCHLEWSDPAKLETLITK